MRSHLLQGKVRHRRSSPFVYELEHDVWYFALDLDEIDEVASKLRLVSRNRRNVLTFRDDDHMLPPAADRSPNRCGPTFRATASTRRTGEITLVTNLRILGYLFNPASFYLCRDAAGELRVVIVEVNNTHGERRLYTLWPERRGDETHGLDGEGLLRVALHRHGCGLHGPDVGSPETELRIAINETEHGSPVLTASLVLRRLPATNRAWAGFSSAIRS
jgi:DUF1365 family protein